MDYIKEAFSNNKIIELPGGGRYSVNPITDHIPATSSELITQIIDEALSILEPIKQKYTLIVGEEDRGGYIASLIAFHLGIPFTLVKWNPDGIGGDVHVDFKNLYTNGKMYVNSIKDNDNILIIEDIIDTGGTLIALSNLIEKHNANVVDIFSLAVKNDYKGLERVKNSLNINPYFLVLFETTKDTSHVTWRYSISSNQYNPEQYIKKSKFYDIHEKKGGVVFDKFFSSIFEEDLNDKNILDLGCGEANDLSHLLKKQANIFGIDINVDAIYKIHNKFPEIKDNFKVGNILDLPYENETFDMVISNYVLQAISDIDLVFIETSRVLKKGASFIFIATHPMRHYFEKKKINNNYFKSEVINSVILDGTIVVQEPTHTMNDFLSKVFLNLFELISFEEVHDPLAEKIQGREYPGFIVIKAKKK